MPKIIITEPDKTPQPYRLESDRIVTKIGRGADNDVILTTGSASTNHCKMKRVEGGFTLVDNNSTNGIKLDETKYEVIDLKDGLTVLIGDDITLDFTLSEDEKELLEGEDFEPQQRAKVSKSKKKPEPDPEPEEEDEDDSEEDEDEDDFMVVLEEAKPKKKTRRRDSDEDDRPRRSSERISTNNNAGHPAAQQPGYGNPPPKSNHAAKALIFLILAILCFFGGMALRHYQDHKTFIFSK